VLVSQPDKVTDLIIKAAEARKQRHVESPHKCRL
jgi:hypothetical protein